MLRNPSRNTSGGLVNSSGVPGDPHLDQAESAGVFDKSMRVRLVSQTPRMGDVNCQGGKYFKTVCLLEEKTSSNLLQFCSRNEVWTPVVLKGDLSAEKKKGKTSRIGVCQNREMPNQCALGQMGLFVG